MLKDTDKLQALVWGRHEGMRGANWLELNCDGELRRRSYLPNPQGQVSETLIGMVPDHEFIQLVSLVEDFISSDPLPEPAGLDPAHRLTLEYITGSSSREWSFAGSETAANPALAKIAGRFLYLEHYHK